jgi:AcrR family transcriptional regulator
MSTDDARSRLLAVAGPIFAEKGFRNATVREICQAAGVNVASVNYYFGDKQRLYVESVKRAHPLHDAPRFSTDWPAATPAPEKLARYIRQAVTQMLGVKSLPWQSQLLTREMMNPSDACRELVEEYFRQRFDSLQEILDEILPPDMPRPRRRLMALSIVAQFVYFRAARHVIEMLLGEEEIRSHHQPQQLAEHIIHMSFAMLGIGPLAGREPAVGATATPSQSTLRDANDEENAGPAEELPSQISQA